MILVAKRIISLRLFFQAPNTYVSVDGYEKTHFQNVYLDLFQLFTFFCVTSQFVLNFTEGSLHHHIVSLEKVSSSECDPVLQTACIAAETSLIHASLLQLNLY